MWSGLFLAIGSTLQKLVFNCHAAEANIYTAKAHKTSQILVCIDDMKEPLISGQRRWL